MRQSTCPVCGATFEQRPGPHRGRDLRYCSQRCKQVRDIEAKKSTHPREVATCAVCSASFERLARRPDYIYCSPECRTESELGPAVRVRSCVTCGAEILQPRQVGGRPSPQCAQCRDSRPGDHYRRHRQAICQRDDWTCGICFRPIDPALNYPAWGSASLDHIAPKSLGGTNQTDNLRATHLVCNRRRGAGKPIDPTDIPLADLLR